MRAAGGNADQRIVGFDPRAVDDFRFFDHAHGEAGEIVVALAVHPRHLRRFTAHQRAARLTAALADATNDLLGDTIVQLAGGEVVEEEQRFRALHDEVVDAHGDQVDADGAVAIEFNGEPEFGTDAVGAKIKLERKDTRPNPPNAYLPYRAVLL